MESYQLPVNVYGLAIAEPLQLDAQVDGPFIVGMEYFRVLSLLVLTYVVQCGFLKVVRQMYVSDWHSQLHDTCSEDLYFLQHVCIFIFCVAVWGSISSTMDMIVGISGAPIKQGYSSLSLRSQQTSHGVVVEADHENDATNAADWMRRRMKKAVTKEYHWNLSGITTVSKCCALLGVALPKLMIGTATMVFGCQFIMLSPDSESLIMNSLAFLFILDIDDYFYHSFTTTTIKARLEDMEPIELNPAGFDRIAHWWWKTFCVPLLLCSATHGVVYLHRKHC